MKELEGQTIFTRLTSPQAVKAAIAECDQFGRDAFLAEYGFKRSREYALLYKDAQYDSKAIAAVALGYQLGVEPPRAEQCTAGKDHGHAAWALDRLGFQVQGIRHNGWWIDEVEATVDAYFNMMVMFEAGKLFKKSDFLARLYEVNSNRSYKAYEYKLQNISAVLKDLGRPWLTGYAPYPRYQHLLRFIVEDRLGRVEPRTKAVTRRSTPRRSKVDWAKREADNRALGQGGERFVFERERTELIAAGRPDLAENVKLVADEADGYGYDIASFTASGASIFIEVKTTTRGAETPFFVSQNELSVSVQKGSSFRLYRVFNFLSYPKIDVFEGPIGEACDLLPAAYRAIPKKANA